jgi:hypothetical protein
MKKRNLTVEQIASRDARRAKFRALAKRVAAMSDGERAELLARMPAVVTIEGRALSPFNSCLIIFQNPGASIVGGFRQWIKHGRAVKKGQHGAQIWVPTGAGGADRENGSARAAAGDSREESGGDDGGGYRFISGTVFDVTQTQDLAAGDCPADVIDLSPADPVPALVRGFVTEAAPVAVVSPEIADAFGMRGLPNVIVRESDGPVLDGWICTKEPAPQTAPAPVAQLTLW